MESPTTSEVSHGKLESTKQLAPNYYERQDFAVMMILRNSEGNLVLKIEMAAKALILLGAGDATGGAVAKRFAQEGFTACIARRNVDKLEPLVKEIEANGGRRTYSIATGCPSCFWPHIPMVVLPRQLLSIRHYNATNIQYLSPTLLLSVTHVTRRLAVT